MNMNTTYNFKYDILPTGDYETVPVTSLVPPYPEYFDKVVQLGIKTDVSKLRKDFNNFDKTGKNYFLDRAKHFKVPLKETIALFDDIGFSMDNYKVYPIRIKGTNKIKPELGEYTKNLLENFGVPLFRQQYVVAKKDWQTKLHIDHPDFTLHGFRVFIPIDTAYIGFEDSSIYKLNPGDCYFVNIAAKHRGISFETDRIVIMCQMASDKLIESGKKMEPCDINIIPEEFRSVPFIMKI